jgi:hypothetical protein
VHACEVFFVPGLQPIRDYEDRDEEAKCQEQVIEEGLPVHNGGAGRNPRPYRRYGPPLSHQYAKHTSAVKMLSSPTAEKKNVLKSITAGASVTQACVRHVSRMCHEIGSVSVFWS